jgi:hypothetical protein
MNLEDKMNYDAVVRLCSSTVQNLLKKARPGFERYLFYLKVIQFILSSYTEKDLSPRERIYRICYAVLAFRYWRFWLKCPLMTSFISLNSYMCAEILAQSLIPIVVKLKAENKPELLTTWLMNSQNCEMYFKALRSYTRVGSTMTNFILEVIDERGTKVPYFIEQSFENNYIVLTNCMLLS